MHELVELPTSVQAQGGLRMHFRNTISFVCVSLLTIPWVCLHFLGIRPQPLPLALLSAMAICGGALLISWASEAAEVDVSRSLSMAILALVAVMPEYAVDIYLSWRAGKDQHYVGLVSANMTGGNRLLVGIGWSLVAFLAWWSIKRVSGRRTKSVALDKDIAVGFLFLACSTAYSLLLPIKGRITPFDALVLSCLYIAYICLATKAPKREVELFGPAQLIASAKPFLRRLLVALLFAYSGFVIFISAEPLAESLKELGRSIGIGEFFMIQWIAPLASEAPEIIVASYFALRLLPTSALTAIISAKLNQWTLLIASLPIVYSISSHMLKPLPLGELQRSEILLTTAQSVFACTILIDFNISLHEASLLLLLFLSQLSMPLIIPTQKLVELSRDAFSLIYFSLSIWMLLRQRNNIHQLRTALQEMLTHTPLRSDSNSKPATEQPTVERSTTPQHESGSRFDEKPTIKFCGAAGEVTGSCHLLVAGKTSILLDCGLIQGGKERHIRNREPFPFDASSIEACILTHAHLDHCGRLPLLIKSGFKGRILATRATCELARIVLLDSAKLNEEDAAWKIKRLKKAGEDYSWVTPLFTTEDALMCIERFEPVDYHEERSVGDLTFRLLDAGHILGSAMVELRLNSNCEGVKILFTGDLGRRNAPIIRDPELVSECDVLVMESTYAGQIHAGKETYMQTLIEAIEWTRERGGKVIIPSFAIERAQDVLYVLSKLFNSGTIKPLPVFVDSPMAIEALKVFRKHVELYDEEARLRLKQYGDPFSFEGLHTVSTVDESKSINQFEEPCIVIAGNGMCTGGRIKHHLKHNIGNPNCTILFVGYQANGTLGRQILDGEKFVRIFGEQHEVRARVVKIEALSGHADNDDIEWWIGSFERAPKLTFAVHGEKDALTSLKQLLSSKGWKCIIPALNDVWRLL